MKIEMKIERGKTPKYRQAMAQLTKLIDDGVLKPGERLPGERVFAEQLGISVSTVVSVVNRLEEKGILFRKRCSGTYVAERKAESRRPVIAYLSFGAHRFSQLILNALWKSSQEKGYDLFPLFREWEELPETVKKYGIDGVFAYNRGDVTAGQIQNLERELGIPIMLLSSVTTENEACSIGYSNEKIIGEAVDYLAGLGHRSIAFLASSTIHPNALRLAAFRNAMSRNGIDAEEKYILTENLGAERLAELLLSKKRPSAVLIANCCDQPLISMVVEKCAIKIPEELSVLAIDENLIYSYFSGRDFSRFRIDVEGFSCAAEDYLLARIRNSPVEKPSEKFYNFIDEKTCKKIIFKPEQRGDS